MSKKPAEKVSPEVDLKVVEDLVEKGELDTVLSNLDPDDVSETLRQVPLGVIRILAAMHFAPGLAKGLRYLTDVQRNTVLKLVKASKKHHGERFVAKLIEAIKTDPAIRELIGVDSFAPEGLITGTEAKMYNYISGITTIPQFMLNSGRVYLDLGFKQEEEVLWQCKLELDEVLLVVASLLSATENTLERLIRTPGIEPTLLYSQCEKGLKKARKSLPQIARRLEALKRRSKRPLSKKRPSKRKKPRT